MYDWATSRARGGKTITDTARRPADPGPFERGLEVLADEFAGSSRGRRSSATWWSRSRSSRARGSRTSCRSLSIASRASGCARSAQAEGKIDQGRARGPLRLRSQRRAQPDGRRPARPARRGPGPRPLGRLRPRRRDQPERDRGDGRGRRRHLEGVPEAAHRRGRPRRRRGHHHGLRRCLPDLPRQALRGLGARRPRRPVDLRRGASIRDDIARRTGARRPDRRAGRPMDRRSTRSPSSPTSTATCRRWRRRSPASRSSASSRSTAAATWSATAPGPTRSAR